MKLKPRAAVSAVLLAFVAVSLVYLVVKELRAPRAAAPGAALENGLVVYYFHGTARCRTCNRIEALTRAALEGHFSPELESGRILMLSLNREKPGNAGYVEDFGLASNSVVVVEFRDGRRRRWKNLKRIWELVADESAFTGYIAEEVRAAGSGAQR